MAVQTNTGKVLLIAGIVLGIAAGGMGAYTMSSAKVSKLNIKVQPQDPAAITALVDQVKQVGAVLSKDSGIKDVSPKGATVNGKRRFAPIFYAPELWQVAINQENVVLDICDPQAPNIHGKVPNTWFIENGLEEDMRYENALSRDTDGDGFSNAEEFAAKTNPKDKASFPDLIGVSSAKMEVENVIREKFVIQVDGGLAYDENPTEASVKLFRKTTDAEPMAKFNVKPNDTFGPKGAEKRFTVLSFERQTFHDSSGGELHETALKVRDNVTTKPEKEFVIRAGNVRSSAANSKDLGTPNEKGRRISDAYAVLRVTAGPKAGTPEGSVRVSEGDTFKLPGAESVVCTLESIDDAGSVNIRVKGAQSSVNVPRAASSKAAKEAPAAPAADSDNGGAEPAPAAGDGEGSKTPAKGGQKGKNRRK